MAHQQGVFKCPHSNRDVSLEELRVQLEQQQSRRATERQCLHSKKKEKSTNSVSDQELGELMLAPSAALKIKSSREPCMLASEDHASHGTWTREVGKIFELMLALCAVLL